MDDLYEMIKDFESDILKIDYQYGYIHINGNYPEEFINVLKEYAKHII